MKKRVYSVLCVVIMLCLLVINSLYLDRNCSIQINDGKIPLGTMDDSFGMRDFANWKSGDYNYRTGLFSENSKRLCLDIFPKVEAGKEFVASISKNDFHILVRVMDNAGKVIASHNLANGESFTVKEGADNLHIGIYQLSESMTYQKYEDLFSNGFEAYLSEKVYIQDNKDIFAMKDFANWQSGDYNYNNGNLTENKTRLCLKEQQSVVYGQKYGVYISDKAYHILIRQIGENGKVVTSHNLQNGAEFSISEKAVSIKIGLYNSVSDTNSGMDYQKYKEYFDNGFESYLYLVEDTSDNIQNEIEDNVNNSVEEDEYFGMASFSNWRSGNYLYTNGLYRADASRICLKDYVNVISGQSYNVNLSNLNYHILIRELDSNNKLVKSYDLANNAKYTVSDSAKKIGISVYDTNGKTISFDMYKELFANGFKAVLISDNVDVEDDKIEDVVNNDNTSDTSDNSSSNDVIEEDDVIVGEDDIVRNDVICDNVENKQDNEYTDIRSEMLAMLESGDTTTHDSSKYNVPWKTVSDTFWDLTENEGIVAYNSCFNMYISTTKDSKGNATTFTLKNLDSGYVARYNALKSIVDKLVSETKGMTDLDKVVYMHDYIVRNATYSKSSNLGYFASGILVDGKGLCNGYANALKLLLRQSGVEVKFVTPSGMQHEWVLIKIDGEWYHADPTWDDTRSSVSGKVSHKFLIRNDAEFSVEGNNKHYGWTGTLSSSTKYTNWFVHNIVGDMYYYNGYWYYADASIKGIKKAKIDGSNMESVVVNETATPVITELDNGTIKYTVNGTTKSVMLNN